MIRTPSFYEYFGKTYRIDDTPDGGLVGHLLNLRTGEFDEDNTHLREVLHATSTADISKLDEVEFVVETEIARAWNLTGDGPIFALYDTINGLRDQAKAEGRKTTREERELIKSLRQRTFKMWAEEFARRAEGTPPTFRQEPRFLRPRQAGEQT